MSLVIGGTGVPELPVVLSTTDDLSNAGVGIVANAAASAIYPVANVAYFYPVTLTAPRTFQKAFWVNGTAVAGNVDVGIYTLSGTTMTRVVASTAEAQATVSVMQVATTFTPTTVGPGRFYWAISCTSITAQFWRMVLNLNVLRSMGAYQSAAQSPLPPSCTVAATTQTNVQVFGFSELSTV